MNRNDLKKLIKECIKEITAFEKAVDRIDALTPLQKRRLEKLKAAKQGNYSVNLFVKVKDGTKGRIISVKPLSLDIETVSGEVKKYPKTDVVIVTLTPGWLNYFDKNPSKYK
jgi:hypothetical protein